MSFRILTVCTGNICRSPLAEQLLRDGLRDLPGVTVESAGTGALVGSGMPQQALALAAQYGVTDAEAHISRQLTEDIARGAGLVLALSRDHRQRIVELAPSVVRRTFTLREFAHIASQVTAEDLEESYEAPGASHGSRRSRREALEGATDGAGSGASEQDIVAAALAAAVAAAAPLRGLVAPLENAADYDVVDPFRRSDETYQRSGRELVPAAETIVAYLEGVVDWAKARTA
ncbi:MULTISPECIES: arsenate reductase/protein-tyrosine-phosphatase family protein [unclassified Pseudoclavibacter]|uniref:arsenate reductase/protein-tyrosine-phosphatase family protein n=1 Tax=unclassified Pseudoclavibacter TaxID=2615177 RepID=UPI0012F39ECE|nr:MULTISPECIES: low molecular weight phosphatase family protein [unclassified Pseudoclavibacter]MBF4457413.1 low molecular weight phosphatase family protein [Pseudoclavibacter sp. VKM Ac-2867]VXC41823.1 Low molecular weight phosphatase family protein [Pseudoclavibacter sp. 8L]